MIYLISFILFLRAAAAVIVVIDTVWLLIRLILLLFSVHSWLQLLRPLRALDWVVCSRLLVCWLLGLARSSFIRILLVLVLIVAISAAKLLPIFSVLPLFPLSFSRSFG